MEIVTMINEDKIVLLIIKVFVKKVTTIEIVIKIFLQKTTSEYKLS